MIRRYEAYDLPGFRSASPTLRNACAVITLLLAFFVTSLQAAAIEFEWEELPPLPVRITGYFFGEHNGALFVAGGAAHVGRNPSVVSVHPNTRTRWGTGIIVDVVYVLEPGAPSWREAGHLPEPRAYGASASSVDGVILFGGRNDDEYFDNLLRLRWVDGAVELDAPSPLQKKSPTPLAEMGFTVNSDTLYVLGGGKIPADPGAPVPFWSLDLANPAADWQVLDPGPLPARTMPGMTFLGGTLYVVGGRSIPKDMFARSPDGAWSFLIDPPDYVYKGPAAQIGVGHLAVLPMYSEESLMVYHPTTDTWTNVNTPDERMDVATLWTVGSDILLASIAGDEEPRTRFFMGRPAPRPSAFGFLDYATITIYFGLLIAMGFYFSRREGDTERFFLGGRRIPWWAVGISIFGTSVSAITYIAIPATAYSTNWVFIINNIGILFLAPFIVAYYLPRLRETPLATAYEYLEKRFNLLTRIYGSIVFAVFQLGRMAIVLYLPAIALSAATGINVYFCILAMGILATLYTVLGGIEAVIWTDVIQSVVLVFGAILALIIVVLNIDGGVPTMISTAAEAGKFHTFNWSWDMTTAAVWVALIGGIFSNGYPAMADQTVVQRYLSTPTAYDASKAVWTNALLTIPIQILFFGLGTALWVFFKSRPDLLDPSLADDAILPLFVVQQFPPGLRGILIAGLFAASMSSLDSSMNSMSSVMVNDYYRRFVKGVTERRALYVARGLTIVFGLFGTVSALYVATINESTIFELFLRFLGLVGGGLAGIFVLGVSTKKANGVGALIGAVTSGFVMFYARQSEVHFFLHGMIGFLTAFVVGYIASRLIGTEEVIR